MFQNDSSSLVDILIGGSDVLVPLRAAPQKPGDVAKCMLETGDEFGCRVGREHYSRERIVHV